MHPAQVSALTASVYRLSPHAAHVLSPVERHALVCFSVRAQVLHVTHVLSLALAYVPSLQSWHESGGPTLTMFPSGHTGHFSLDDAVHPCLYCLRDVLQTAQSAHAVCVFTIYESLYLPDGQLWQTMLDVPPHAVCVSCPTPHVPHKEHPKFVVGVQLVLTYCPPGQDVELLHCLQKHKLSCVLYHPGGHCLH